MYQCLNKMLVFLKSDLQITIDNNIQHHLFRSQAKNINLKIHFILCISLPLNLKRNFIHWDGIRNPQQKKKTNNNKNYTL